VNCLPTDPWASNMPGLSCPRWALAGVCVAEALPPVDLGPTCESWGWVLDEGFMVMACLRVVVTQCLPSNA
jgi:hypothetical protein